MNIQTFAAIDIGSFELTMKIYEFSGKNHMREVDYISRRLDLGTDTYSRGKISNDKMDELCRTLNEFRDIMKTYRVEEYPGNGKYNHRTGPDCAAYRDEHRGIKQFRAAFPGL